MGVSYVFIDFSSASTVKNQLHEQQKKKKASSEEVASILDPYLVRWPRCAAAIYCQ
jgi:hypothetical protein